MIHINTIGGVHVDNSFSISESGMIGISCNETPSLTVMFPGMDKSPTVLSNNKVYHSATFMKISGKEYLVAGCEDDGCLYLWNTVSKTSKKVFDPKLSSEQHPTGMYICRINESTIGYGESRASSDGSRRVFILKTYTKEWNLSSTLRLYTPNTIVDMCYTEMDGGTPCLLLCVPYSRCVMAVEMIGGKTRWEAGKQQLGKIFNPWSICTDEDNTVYVTDFDQNMIHLLSAEDGSVIRSIDASRYGMGNLVTARIHDKYLYIEHYRYPGNRYAISKFKRDV